MQVYISYARADQPLAKRVADVLRASGMTVWLGAEQILPGDNWGEHVGRALRESDAMVVLLTPNTAQSSNLEYDLGYALGSREYEGRVVAVKAGSVQELSHSEFPWILSKFPTIHLPHSGREPDDLGAIAKALLPFTNPN